METEGYDAIVLAATGLEKMNMLDQATEIFEIDVMVPAVGQAILGIELIDKDGYILDLVKQLKHEPTKNAADAERAFLIALGGGCNTPIAAYAQATETEITIQGIYASEDGIHFEKATISGKVGDKKTLARKLATQLKDKIEQKLNKNKIPCFIVSNQSGLAKNEFGIKELQKIISIVISSLTAIPIYFLGKKFFSKELALLGSILFIFEPRIVQNSTFGVSDPLYIIGITIAIVLLLYSRKNFEFLAFVILGLSITVRSEGLFLIPAFVIIYFWQKKVSKNSIIKILISLLIITTILSAITYYQNIGNENHNLFTKMDLGINEIYVSPETTSAGSPINLLIDGFINFIKFLGWSQIPIWVIFVPAGFIILLISRNINTGIIFTLLFFISIPTLYAFSFTNDTRYLFPLYPIFSVVSLFFLTKFENNKKVKNIVKITVITGLIISSSIFLIWKDVDIENEQEIFELVKEISYKEMVVNNFGYESSYRIPAGLEKSQIFPISSNEINRHTTKMVNNPRVDSLKEFMEFGIKNKLTHLVIKDVNQYTFLDNIYKNEENYSFLIKEYDSKDKGYEIHLKIFKVNYEKYEMIKIISKN